MSNAYTEEEPSFFLTIEDIQVMKNDELIKLLVDSTSINTFLYFLNKELKKSRAKKT